MVSRVRVASLIVLLGCGGAVTSPGSDSTLHSSPYNSNPENSNSNSDTGNASSTPIGNGVSPPMPIPDTAPSCVDIPMGTPGKIVITALVPDAGVSPCGAPLTAVTFNFIPADSPASILYDQHELGFAGAKLTNRCAARLNLVVGGSYANVVTARRPSMDGSCAAAFDDLTSSPGLYSACHDDYLCVGSVADPAPEPRDVLLSCPPWAMFYLTPGCNGDVRPQCVTSIEASCGRPLCACSGKRLSCGVPTEPWTTDEAVCGALDSGTAD